jgi:hypothetical protein
MTRTTRPVAFFVAAPAGAVAVFVIFLVLFV